MGRDGLDDKDPAGGIYRGRLFDMTGGRWLSYSSPVTVTPGFYRLIKLD